MSMVRSTFGRLGAVELWRTTALAGGRVRVFCFVSFSVFFEMVRRLHLEVKIRSSSPYFHSGGVYSTSQGHVELCDLGISQDPVGFCVRWCGFRSNSFNLRVSCLMTVAAFCTLVLWSLSTTTSYLSTTTSSNRTRDTPTTRVSVCSCRYMI
jgi:hypothetical protein